MSLGRGLESLIPSKEGHTRSSGTSSQTESAQARQNKAAKTSGQKSENIFYIEVDKIKPNPHQPRRDFNEEELASLASSIQEHGILQPLVISKHEIEVSRGRRVEYHIVAGERRWRAAQMAGFKQVPAVVRETTEQTKLELALIENIQREDLNPIEEARAFEKLSSDFSLTQEQIAKRVGKSREAVANKMRLLSLPHEVHTALQSGAMSEGHAKVLLSLKNPEKQIHLAGETSKKNWSVRALEEHVKRDTGGNLSQSATRQKPQKGADPELEELKRTISEQLGTSVSIHGSKQRGRLAIAFSSQEELDRIIARIAGERTEIT